MSERAPGFASNPPLSPRRIERALLTVSDKTGIVELARSLVEFGAELLSTGGTARTLRDAGLSVTDVADRTGFPEMLDGRVKTLHPRIHGGILARRDLESHRTALTEHDITTIDLVVVNLYPFESKVDRQTPFEEAIEEIDIGGPTMIRAAAKNHGDVAVVVDPQQYRCIEEELRQSDGALSAATRRQLAATAFRRTAAYDARISNWFGHALDGDFPTTWTEQWSRRSSLRYGENPHQEAAWYGREDGHEFSLAECHVHESDKELSYNNLLDASAAIECARGLSGAAAVIVKHCLPCGAAERESGLEAFEAALAGDPVSAFGGILALTVPFDLSMAKAIATPKHFFEVIHAPEVSTDAIAWLREQAKWGKKCRVLSGGTSPAGKSGTQADLRSVSGGVLLQTPDRTQPVQPSRVGDGLTVATERTPNTEEWRDLAFAWKVIPHVRSNAILLARGGSIAGVGAGQPSRVDAVRIACAKAEEFTEKGARGSALASDAFFPFPDGLEVAARAGVTAVVQPGGSIRDKAVIKAANEAGIAMVLTGERHFRH